MSTSAQEPSGGAQDRGESKTSSRLHISQRAIENAKTAASSALEVLGMVAEVTENVPYLGAISKALTAFNDILGDVSVCKEDCTATIDEAEQLRLLLQRHEGKRVQFSDGDDGPLREEFKDLNSTLLDCLQTLHGYRANSKRRRDWFRLLFKRGDVQASVKRCRDKMQTAKDKFNTTVGLDTNFKVSDMYRRFKSVNVAHELVVATGSSWQLRAANNIFHGRDSEVKAAIDLIVNRAPARVAILGPGGIGKTSIALAVLHDPKVKNLYGDHRCFTSCKAATTADAVVRALAKNLELSIEKDTAPETACKCLFSYLRTASGIICLDNFETPLTDDDKPAIEELLNEIAALDSVALLITSRDTSRPTIRWTSPPLSHIQPLSQEAALSTWDDICGLHDEYAIRLVDAVDCMPLAVTLLARLAADEGSAKRTWDRWEKEHIDFVRIGRKEHRLLSVTASIEISLSALSDREGATKVLCIVCMSPDGFLNDAVPGLQDVFRQDLSLPVSHYLTELRRLSLSYTVRYTTRNTEPELEFLEYRALSPIRHHILQHYLSDDLIVTVANLIARNPMGWNVGAFWIFCLNYSDFCRDRCLQVMVSAPSESYDPDLLSQALAYEKSRAPQPWMRSGILRQLGLLKCLQERYQDAEALSSEAMELDKQFGHGVGLFLDCAGWLWNRASELRGKEAECEELQELQEAILQAWKLGRESRAWASSDVEAFTKIAKAQHAVNEGRRKLNLPIIYPSGLYWDNNSIEELHDAYQGWEATECYERLLQLSIPPWDLALILETHRALGHERPDAQKVGDFRRSHGPQTWYLNKGPP
ncbi:unnamed protein product [Peniophora sp. CBMAI 1063]|nr:unnamed protein product [Peniophora sp. CBMAI 1063]